MKPTPISLRLILGLFIFTRLLLIVATVALVGFLLASPAIALRFDSLEFARLIGRGTARVTLTPDDYNLRARDQTQQSKIGSPIVKPMASIPLDEQTLTRLAPAIRRGVLPGVVAIAGFWAWILSLAIRLMRDVISGASFTDRNILSLHKIGVGLMILVAVNALSESWFVYEVWGGANFAIRGKYTNLRLVSPREIDPNRFYFEFNTEMSDIEPLASWQKTSLIESSPWRMYYFSLQPFDLIYGLSVLALGEVFRQGLRLRRESELTI